MPATLEFCVTGKSTRRVYALCDQRRKRVCDVDRGFGACCFAGRLLWLAVKREAEIDAAGLGVSVDCD